ncbi:MAG TPA: HAD family hydrolase [Candidatus Binataceae bacterium]
MARSEAPPLTLVFDADDTLWDSNIHFLEAFDQFAAAITAAGIAIAVTEIKSVVHRTELELIGTLGYGRRPYVTALAQAARELASMEEALLTPILAEVDRIGTHLVERTCELLPDVEVTLRELSTRHRLMLFTKGNRDEQLPKLERSGLAPLFDRVETPREKDVHAYRRLVQAAELAPAATVMIGNSPRSDINPAVRAGLRAVYIPHPHTWELEHEELDDDERIIELPAFRNLVEIF